MAAIRGNPSSVISTPESAPALPPATFIARSLSPCAGARDSSGSEAVSSAELAMSAADQPVPSSRSPIWKPTPPRGVLSAANSDRREQLANPRPRTARGPSGRRGDRRQD
jgi:hypothetical protein